MKQTLLSRSFLWLPLLFILSVTSTFAQPYKCTDLSPGVVSAGNNAIDIDLNNDAVIDFRLTGLSVPSVDLVMATASQIGVNNYVLSDGAGNALALPFNASIGPASTTWHQMNSGNLGMMLNNNGTTSGTWLGVADQYLGLQLVVGANTFYGWAKLSFSNSVNTFTLTDFAYDTIPNQAIAAGVGCASIPTPLFALTHSICPGISTTLTANTGTQSGSTYSWVSIPAGGVFSASGTSATAVSFPSAGTYSILMAVTSGTNFGFFQDTVRVNPTPVFTLTSSSPSLCPNQQFTLTATGPYAGPTYTFISPFGGPLPVSGASFVSSFSSGPATYTALASLAGCLEQNTITVGLTSFQPTLTVSSSSVCIGKSITLTASGGASVSSYTFASKTGTVINLICSGCSSVQVVTPSVPTRYQAVAVSSGGCIDTTLSVFVSVVPVPSITAIASSLSVCPGSSVILTGAAPVSGAVSYTWSNGAYKLVTSVLAGWIVSPVVNTTYTLFVVDTQGCIGSSTVTVGVDPSIPLSVQAISSSSVICLGQADTLVASCAPSTLGNLTYSWSSNVGGSASGSLVVVSPTVSTSYSVTGSNNLGCTGSTIITVGIDPIQFIQALASHPVICPGQHDTLVASCPPGTQGNLTYSWSSSTGGTALTGSLVVVSPSVSTSYSVTGSDNLGCVGSSQVNIALGCVGIEEYKNPDASFVIYPNPVNDLLYIRAETSGNYTIELIDVLGNTVSKQTESFKSGDPDHLLSTQSISPGVYFLKLSTDNNGIQTIRLIKQ